MKPKRIVRSWLPVIDLHGRHPTIHRGYRARLEKTHAENGTVEQGKNEFGPAYEEGNIKPDVEIERLQADAERLQLIIDSCHEDLNCKSNTIDELDSYLDQCRIVINQKEARIKELEAEIRELEDAHKRSGAKYAKIINELRSSVYANIPGLSERVVEAKLDVIDQQGLKEFFNMVSGGGNKAKKRKNLGDLNSWKIK